MKKQIIIFYTLFSAAALVAGCTEAERATSLPPGTYEETTKTTDSQGTTTEKQTTTKVEEDASGNKRAVVKSKTTKDPRGLFNKTTTSESTEVIDQRE